MSPEADDLVRRLRDRSNNWTWDGDPGGDPQSLLDEAADRIEALERDLAKIKAKGATPKWDGEGKYESQWHAWDDGYCQGLGISDERHEPEEQAAIKRATTAEARLAVVEKALERIADTVRLTAKSDKTHCILALDRIAAIASTPITPAQGDGE